MEEERSHSHNPPTRVVPQDKRLCNGVPAVGSLSRKWCGSNTRRKALSLLSRVVLPLALVGVIYIAIRPDYVPLVSIEPGFELFDTTRLGMTDRNFDALYVRALQNELSRTIRIGSGYDDVNVYVTIPKRVPVKEDQALPSAWVKIITSRGISQQQVIVIQNLVAGAVPKLKPENVKVFDGTSKLLAGVTGENEQSGAEVRGSSHE